MFKSVLSNIFTVPPAPMNPGVVRVNAEQIRVHWAAVMRRDYRQPITHYTVKYYPLNMEVQSAYKMINTSNTEIVISDLDPVRMYAVSIAANSEAGRGNFSKEMIAGCKYHQRGDLCGKTLNQFHIWSSVSLLCITLCDVEVTHNLYENLNFQKFFPMKNVLKLLLIHLSFSVREQPLSALF